MYLRRDGWIADDEFFYAEQNARLVRDAEEYYQQMYRAEVSSWNLRDRHMAGTLDALVEHLDQQVPRAKIVVWEHNSHVGDARATEMGARGELNVGQLARQRYGHDCLPDRVHHLRRHSHRGHGLGRPRRAQACAPCPRRQPRGVPPRQRVTALLAGHRQARVHEVLVTPRLERAIGVIYRPQTERAESLLRRSSGRPIRCRHPP